MPKGRLEVMKMEKDEEFARKVLEAFLTSRDLQGAILNMVCACPNITTEF